MVFHKYELGDNVWCLHETRRVGVSSKLERAFDGPFLITEKRSPINFVIQLNKNGQTLVVHHDKLKPYKGINPPLRASKLRKRLLNRRA